jgi:outer membrane biosynthesis protein TonB
MSATFEAEKNKKAFAYTIVICGTLMLLAFLISWPILQPPIPIAQELLEINLGNNEEGMGEIQPLIKGEMAPLQEVSPPAASNESPKPEETKEIKPEENAEVNAAPVAKTEKKILKKKIEIKPEKKVVKKIKNTPIIAPPSPKPAKPKLTYNGPGSGKGNGATEDNGYQFQGNKPGGKGDAGDPSGKPDSYGNSPGGKTGVSVTKGVRPLNMRDLRFEDDFNENAIVFLDIKYSASGNFISSVIAKGTTTSKSSIIGIAKRKAAELKFPSSDDGGISTVVFNFKIQN